MRFDKRRHKKEKTKTPFDISTYRSIRGTVRGVKNRVRAGIATFLQDQTAKVTFAFFFISLNFQSKPDSQSSNSHFRFASTLIIIFSLEIHACHVCSSIELTQDPFWFFQAQPLTHTHLKANLPGFPRSGL